MDEPIGVIATRIVSEHLTATGHDAAGRAMHRVVQRQVLPYSDGRVHVYLACEPYDAALLGGLTLSIPGSRSRALDDAYARVYPWVTGPFSFHFITPASSGLRAV
jgi:hypothetical protein